MCVASASTSESTIAPRHVIFSTGAGFRLAALQEVTSPPVDKHSLPTDL